MLLDKFRAFQQTCNSYLMPKCVFKSHNSECGSHNHLHHNLILADGLSMANLRIRAKYYLYSNASEGNNLFIKDNYGTVEKINFDFTTFSKNIGGLAWAADSKFFGFQAFEFAIFVEKNHSEFVWVMISRYCWVSVLNLHIEKLAWIHPTVVETLGARLRTIFSQNDIWTSW